jgi:hypothetical protein
VLHITVSASASRRNPRPNLVVEFQVFSGRPAACTLGATLTFNTVNTVLNGAEARHLHGWNMGAV